MIYDNRYIATFLREARNNANMTAKEASEKLSEYGIKLSGTTISGYENNRSKPDAEKFLALCSIYGINNPIQRIQNIMKKYGGYSTLDEKIEWDEAEDLAIQAQEVLSLSKVALTLREKELINTYRSLNNYNQELIDSLISKIYNSQIYRKENQILEPVKLVSQPVYELPDSTGTGQFLDSDNYELIEFPEEDIPQDSNFAVRVRDNSMAPDYPDGSIVFVKSVKLLAPEEVGIFILNNEGFIRKLGKSNVLEPVNPDYEDIPVKKNDNYRLVGKVVGKYLYKKN